jgi:serine/threonine protein kinase
MDSPPSSSTDDAPTLQATGRLLSEGTRIVDRYVLRRMLGRGGMGVVWLAQDEKLEREVALKFVPDVVSLDAAARDDLKRETRRCLELTHPNVVRIYDFIEDKDLAGISMEFIDGRTLSAERVSRPSRVFEVDELRQMLGPLLSGLAYAHREAKVVHRDLKPSNLMVTSRGQVKISDFGIARSISDSVSRVSMVSNSSGTLVYMSPQQLDGEPPRAADDIYSLGATLYDLLTSRPPFHSGNIDRQIREKVPPSMANRRAELGICGSPIPPEWEKAIASCLEKDPALRPASMGHLAEMLGIPGAPSPDPGATLLPAFPVAPPRMPAPGSRTHRPRWLMAMGSIAAVVLAGWLAAAVAFAPAGPSTANEESANPEKAAAATLAQLASASRAVFGPHWEAPPSLANLSWSPETLPAPSRWSQSPHLESVKAALQRRLPSDVHLADIKLKGQRTAEDGSTSAAYELTLRPAATYFLAPIVPAEQIDDAARRNPKTTDSTVFVPNLPAGFAVNTSAKAPWLQSGRDLIWPWTVRRSVIREGAWRIIEADPLPFQYHDLPIQDLLKKDHAFVTLLSESQLATLERAQIEALAAFREKVQASSKPTPSAKTAKTSTSPASPSQKGGKKDPDEAGGVVRDVLKKAAEGAAEGAARRLFNR